MPCEKPDDKLLSTAFFIIKFTSFELPVVILARRRKPRSDDEKKYRLMAPIEEHMLGPEDPNTLRSRSRIALALMNRGRQGRYTEAEEMHRQKLEIRERVLGAEHPDTLWSRHSLAVTLQKLNRYAEAEEMDRQTLELRERVLGAEHPDTLRSCDSLAEVLARLGGHDDAERVRRGETLTRATDTMGNEAQHPQQSESHRCCLICMSNEIVWVCVHGDVSHKVFCDQCKRRYEEDRKTTCPVCRQPIERYTRVV